MGVRVSIKSCGGMIEGKFACIEGDRITLFLDAGPDRGGTYRGLGKTLRFSAADVDISADRPDVEIERRARRRFFFFKGNTQH